MNLFNRTRLYIENLEDNTTVTLAQSGIGEAEEGLCGEKGFNELPFDLGKVLEGYLEELSGQERKMEGHPFLGRFLGSFRKEFVKNHITRTAVKIWIKPVSEGLELIPNR